jgi:mannosyltransferase OCH1-like enzyme
MKSLLRIPRTFHQIWLGGRPIPEHYRIWADRWLEMNPGWTMNLWTDKHLPEIVNHREFEAAEKMAAKSDILRYEICARYGGVYIDSDFEPLNSIESILAGVSAFQGDELDDRPCNAILGCAVGDPFFQALVKALPESIRSGGDIVETTGPKFLKRVIADYLGPNRRRIDDPAPGVGGRRWRIVSEDGKRSLHGFHWSVFYPYHYDQPELENKSFPNAFGKHHWMASWWKNGGI